jgi:hypothetical protein
MKKNIGFIILHIEKNQSKEIISFIKTMADSLKDKRMVVFNSYNNGIIENIPVLHINQAKFFDGNLFVFDIIGLMLAVSCYKVQNIYYYAYNFPWMMDQTTDFNFWSKLIEDSRVNIIAQNQEIYDIYDKVWKTPVTIAGDVSHNEFQRQI